MAHYKSDVWTHFKSQLLIIEIIFKKQLLNIYINVYFYFLFHNIYPFYANLLLFDLNFRKEIILCHLIVNVDTCLYLWRHKIYKWLDSSFN